MQKKALIITLVILGIAAYTLGSIWVVGMMKQNTAVTTTTLPQTNVPDATRTNQPPIATPTPMPTPTPLQGPGVYACDADGICNSYSDELRTSCPKTFADSHCLGMCGTPSVRCSP